MQGVKDAVQRWLDEADTAMAGGAERRQDVLLELETVIYDRVDERTRKGDSPDQAVKVVLRDIGNPMKVGNSFLPERPLLASHHTRPFLINTGVLFVAHFLLVVVATVVGKPLGLSFLSVAPIGDPGNFLEFFMRAAGTLVFDAGLVLCSLAVTPRLSRLLRLPRIALVVRPDSRRCIDSALFFALVLIVVNFFRDDLLALYLPAETGSVQVSLAGPGLVHNLVFINVWLALAVVRDLVYARWGERPAALALDVATCGVGLFCLLRIVAAENLVNMAPALEALGPTADGLGAIFNQVFSVTALFGALLLGGRLVRRSVRLLLLRK